MCLVTGTRALKEFTYHHLAPLQRIAIGLAHGLRPVFGQQPVCNQASCVDCPRGLHLADTPIHLRLGHHRLIGLVVALASIADQVDDHIILEGQAIIEGQTGDEQNRIRVVSVDVKNGRLDQLGDLCAIQGRTRLLRMAGGEPDLIVDHHMDGATRAIGRRLGKIQGLGNHALTDEGGIAMDDHRQNQITALLLMPVLARPATPLNHRRYDLQV